MSNKEDKTVKTPGAPETVTVDAGELALLRAVKCAYDMIVEKAKIESALPKQVKLIEQMQAARGLKPAALG